MSSCVFEPKGNNISTKGVRLKNKNYPPNCSMWLGTNPSKTAKMSLLPDEWSVWTFMEPGKWTVFWYDPQQSINLYDPPTQSLQFTSKEPQTILSCTVLCPPTLPSIISVTSFHQPTWTQSLKRPIICYSSNSIAMQMGCGENLI